MWTRGRAVAVAAGGAIGAGARWAVLAAWPPPDFGFPWPVLLINAAGALVLGAALAEEMDHQRLRLILHDFVGIGFCGGLTTFSTFAVEIVDLIDAGRTPTAVLYAVASVGLAVVALVAGAASLRRLRALALPLEGQP